MCLQQNLGQPYRIITQLNVARKKNSYNIGYYSELRLGGESVCEVAPQRSHDLRTTSQDYTAIYVVSTSAQILFSVVEGLFLLQDRKRSLI
jgi:hypothetical protein